MAYTGNELLIRSVMSGHTGLPEDEIVGDFAFGHGQTDQDITDAFNAVDDFWRVVQTSGLAVSNWISEFVPRNVTHRLEAYNIQDHPTDPAKSMLGSPVRTDAWLGPIAPFEATGLPTEVAAVLSFHAELFGQLEEVGDTRPKARRRGRLYIGPLIDDAVATTVVPYLLSATLNTTLRQAALALMDDAATIWGVWSRKDKLVRPVVGGWTDDAPDTQRRRGAAATARVLWGDLDV